MCWTARCVLGPAEQLQHQLSDAWKYKTNRWFKEKKICIDHISPSTDDPANDKQKTCSWVEMWSSKSGNCSELSELKYSSWVNALYSPVARLFWPHADCLRRCSGMPLWFVCLLHSVRDQHQSCKSLITVSGWTAAMCGTILPPAASVRPYLGETSGFLGDDRRSSHIPPKICKNQANNTVLPLPLNSLHLHFVPKEWQMKIATNFF